MYVLLFDIDGTLLRSGGAGQAAMEAALAREFGQDRPVTGLTTAGRTDFAITSELFAHYGLAVDEPTWQRFQRAYFELLPQHLAGKSGMVLPGVLYLLELLAAREDVAVGLLTGNFERGAQLKLAHFAIAHHFTFGSYGDHHASRDDVARQALRHIQREHPQAAIERVWVIGDTPADIQCARAIGARVLAVATGMFPAAELAAHSPDLLRESLENPAEWLPQMLPPV
jgi:phosphoglycolate phosphatase